MKRCGELWRARAAAYGLGARREQVRCPSERNRGRDELPVLTTLGGRVTREDIVRLTDLASCAG